VATLDAAVNASQKAQLCQEAAKLLRSCSTEAAAMLAKVMHR
jgi:hypothetical protein